MLVGGSLAVFLCVFFVFNVAGRVCWCCFFFVIFLVLQMVFVADRFGRLFFGSFVYFLCMVLFCFLPVRFAAVFSFVILCLIFLAGRVCGSFCLPVRFVAVHVFVCVFVFVRR